MSRKSGLGKGLGALIPSDAASVSTEEGVAALQEIPIDAVVPNQLQPREHFDRESLESLTASIRELGVLQPILVRPVGNGFELIAGERRWRSARQAGLTSIPAIVREVEDRLSLEHAIVENLHREDLNSIEEAAAYQQLCEEFGLTQDEVAERVGKSRSSVANTIRLLNLTPNVQALVVDKILSAGHARTLVAVSDPKVQEELATRVIAEGLTVRQIEAIVRGDEPDQSGSNSDAGSGTGTTRAPKSSGGTGSPESTAEKNARSAALLDLEQLLADRLDTRVSVEMGSKHGQILIDFADIDDLERLARIVVQGDSY